MPEPLWWTHKEDRRQAPGCRIEATTPDQIIYHLVIPPHAAWKIGPRVALKIRCFDNGDILMAWERWRA